MNTKCPKCGSTAYTRISRRWWMRLVPGAKYFACNRCSHAFLAVGGGHGAQSVEVETIRPAMDGTPSRKAAPIPDVKAGTKGEERAAPEVPAGPPELPHAPAPAPAPTADKKPARRPEAEVVKSVPATPSPPARARPAPAAEPTGAPAADLPARLAAAEQEVARLSNALAQERERARKTEQVAAQSERQLRKDVAKLDEVSKEQNAQAGDLRNRLVAQERETTRLTADLAKEKERARKAEQVAANAQKQLKKAVWEPGSGARDKKERTVELAATLAAAEREAARLTEALAAEKARADAAEDLSRKAQAAGDSAAKGAQAQSADLTRKLAAAEREVARLTEALAAEKARADAAEIQLRQVQAGREDARSAEVDVAQLTAKFAAAQRDVDRLTHELARERDRIRGMEQQATETRERFQRNLAEAENAARERKERAAELTQKLAAAERDISGLTREITAEKDNARAAEERAAETERQLGRRISELEEELALTRELPEPRPPAPTAVEGGQDDLVVRIAAASRAIEESERRLREIVRTVGSTKARPPESN